MFNISFLCSDEPVRQEEEEEDNGNDLLPINQQRLYGMFEEYLQLMEKRFNFTGNRWRRRDQRWGTVDIEGNGDGLFWSVLNDDIDIIAASMTVNPERFRGINFLLPLGMETRAIFIKRIGAQELDWTVFLQPFSWELRYSLLGLAALFVVVLKFVEKVTQNEPETQGTFANPVRLLSEYLLSYWYMLCSYFGRPPPRVYANNKDSIRMVTFVILLIGIFVFMSYRASLTSELSTRRNKLPFTDMNGLLASPYQ